MWSLSAAQYRTNNRRIPERAAFVVQTLGQTKPPNPDIMHSLPRASLSIVSAACVFEDWIGRSGYRFQASDNAGEQQDYDFEKVVGIAT